MKYCVVIMDGAADLPLPEYGGRTVLEIAGTPNLDAMASEGLVGLIRTVPEGMEASSACACMSVLGYDPKVYYKGRGGIEARSMGIPVGQDEVVFRCNLVAVRDGRMWSFSAGHISTGEAKELIDALNISLGSDRVRFYPGVNYRHIIKISGRQDTLQAICTPPHDIPGKPVNEYLPHGPGSDFLLDLMERSKDVLKDHPVNLKRISRGDIPATQIWLFWGSPGLPDMPSFQEVYGLRAAMTSGVDLLQGMAEMVGMDVLNINGVTDNLDNDFGAQATGALSALEKHDLVVIHVEAPDEAGHVGSVGEKKEAIEKIDSEVIGRIRLQDSLRVLVMPDHPTPTQVRTHIPDPVPFLLWGEGFASNGARRFTEAEATKTDLFIDPGYYIMAKLTK